MGYHVAIDVGGTFTDVCVADPDGRMAIHKTPTTPDVAAGVLEGLRLAAEAAGTDLPAFLARVDRFAHGSTVAVNALLQGRGARTGLVTTRGFADTLWIARMMAMTTGLPQEQWTHYRKRQRPNPPVERRLVREVDERVDFRGEVVVPLDPANARQAIRELLDQGIEALAVCTLWSFRNPVHERMLREAARAVAPELYVSLSSELVPVIKEYERMAMTAVNASLGPIVRAYLSEMDRRLREAGFRRDFFMLNSVAGVIPPGEAAAKPVHLLGSGPSGGVLAARTLADQLGHPHVLTADMGGTSFDAGLIVDGEPLLVTESAVGNLNLLNPMLDIRSIGCGGGSLAIAVDGALRVGPRSAGAVPGPACYGRGGEQPTVTDADLVLGSLNPEYFLGGRMRLHGDAAWEAIRRHVADPLGLSVPDAAAGIREVADQQMADLLRQRVLERGYDPRDFVLYAYGGAGPVHACAFGSAAGVRSIVIPLAATVFSAQGILGADLRLSRQRSALQRTGGGPVDGAEGLDGAALEQAFRELEGEAQQALRRYGRFGAEGTIVLRSLSVRYARQVHELRVPVEASLAEPGAMVRLLEAFRRLYEQRYGPGAASRGAVVEITTCHLQVVLPLPKPALVVPSPPGPTRPAGTRRVYLDRRVAVPVYRREELPLKSRLDGPALVDAAGTSVWIGPNHVAQVDDVGNLLLEARR